MGTEMPRDSRNEEAGRGQQQEQHRNWGMGATALLQKAAVRLWAQMGWLCKGRVRTGAWGAAWGFLTAPNI